MTGQPTGSPTYDAVLIVAFGGPEKREDVVPFLENVLRGKNVARSRLLEVAEHYYHCGGASPLNGQIRQLIAALRDEFDRNGLTLPIYWGNRNWDPLMPDTLARMTADGVTRALAVVVSAYSSYSSCRQYRDDVARAQQAVGPAAPVIDKVRVFYNHPLFIEANADHLSEALDRFAAADRDRVHVAFTAHSIPQAMADHCDYVKQLMETCRLVSESAGIGQDRWQLVYQSRSGRPSDPWLEPDVVDHIQQLHDRSIVDAVVMPVGFLSDHMEVIYDLDVEAAARAQELGMQFVRGSTVGTHPKFVAMLRELVEERLGRRTARRAIGRYGPSHDVCPQDCCPPPSRPAADCSRLGKSSSP